MTSVLGLDSSTIDSGVTLGVSSSGNWHVGVASSVSTDSRVDGGVPFYSTDSGVDAVLSSSSIDSGVDLSIPSDSTESGGDV